MPLSGVWDVASFVVDLLDLVCNWRFAICLVLGIAVGMLLQSSTHDPVAANIAFWFPVVVGGVMGLGWEWMAERR